MSTKRIKSNSTVQIAAEQILIQWLSEQLSVTLKGFQFCIDGCKMNVDGYYRDEKRIVLVEAWAHIGKAKSAQKNKVLTDVLKLAYICDCIAKEYETASVECITYLRTQLRQKCLVTRLAEAQKQVSALRYNCELQISQMNLDKI